MRKPKDMYVIKYSHVDGRLQPMLRFALLRNGQTVTVAAYVDSGATYSLFSPGVAEDLGLKTFSLIFYLFFAIFISAVTFSHGDKPEGKLVWRDKSSRRTVFLWDSPLAPPPLNSYHGLVGEGPEESPRDSETSQRRVPLHLSVLSPSCLDGEFRVPC